MTRLVGKLAGHWQLKLLSLMFAIALWAFVTLEDWTEAVHTVPLDFVNVPPGLTATATGDETVEVRIRGLRGILAGVGPRDLRAEVGLDVAEAGEFVTWVLPQDVRVPRGVEVVRVTPSRIRGRLIAVSGEERR